MSARLLPELETLGKVTPRSVACATISGVFLRAGGPLAQQVLESKRKISAADERAERARDCLLVALSLYPDPPSAHPLLATLLYRMGQAERALEVAEDGLYRMEDAIAEAESDDSDDEFGELEDLRREERQLQELVDALAALLDSRADAQDRADSLRSARSPSVGGPRAPTVLVEYSKDQGKRGPDWLQNNVDPILGLRFRPIPDDPAWNQITAENVAAYQLWFQRALLRAELHKAHSAEVLVGKRAEGVCKTAFEAKEQHGLNPLLVLVLAHQYVEADSMMRAMHTTDWVAFMMTRSEYAPSPESIANFVIGFYGLQKEP